MRTSGKVPAIAGRGRQIASSGCALSRSASHPLSLRFGDLRRGPWLAMTPDTHIGAPWMRRTSTGMVSLRGAPRIVRGAVAILAHAGALHWCGYWAKEFVTTSSASGLSRSATLRRGLWLAMTVDGQRQTRSARAGPWLPSTARAPCTPDLRSARGRTIGRSRAARRRSRERRAVPRRPSRP